jgi:hypothetical protein
MCPMPALTRRRYPERQDCWHVFYGDVHVGTIAILPGLPVDVDQWGWDIGFYPGTKPRQERGGTSETFDQAHADFEAAGSAADAHPRPTLIDGERPATRPHGAMWQRRESCRARSRTP